MKSHNGILITKETKEGHMTDEFGREKYVFSVPSGIGDISWMYSKLMNIPEVADGSMKMEVLIADGWPYRALPFVQLLPLVSASDYGNHEYDEIVTFEKFHKLDYRKTTWDQVRKMGFGMYFMQNNHFLEEGRRLEEWLPDLPANFHYPMKVTEDDSKVADRLLEKKDRAPIVGIFGSSKRGVKLWKGWLADEWFEYISLLHQNYDCQFLLMGAQWDHEIMDEIQFLLTKVKIPFINVVGKTSISVAIELMKRLNYFTCFSSGLNVLATIVKTPCCTMWPEFQDGLRYRWAPTDLIASGDYRAYIWTEPRTVFRSIKPILDRKLTWR